MQEHGMSCDLSGKCLNDKPGNDIPENGGSADAGDSGAGGGCGAVAVRGGLGAEHAARRQPGQQSTSRLKKELYSI